MSLSFGITESNGDLDGPCGLVDTSSSASPNPNECRTTDAAASPIVERKRS